MNEKAKNLGMKKTSFSNPVGLDADGNQVHYSTAKDLYKLASASTSNPLIKDIVSKRYYYIETEDQKFTKYITNTNKLLSEIPHTTGIKTGTTAGAGEVLIYEYEADGKDLIIVVMGSSDRFYDTRALLSWTLRSYDWGF
jgi:D-alanyl-D-alanine carboxypeptidase (penicillin-binding protein 5/6)